MEMQLSKTSSKILQLFLHNGNKPLYINELIRETNSYPNAVQQSLKTLQKQHLLFSEEQGNNVFFSLNKKHPNLSAIKRAHTRLAARNFAISSKKLLWELKKNESCFANLSIPRPAFWANSTYAIALAIVNATSWTAVDPASRM